MYSRFSTPPHLLSLSTIETPPSAQPRTPLPSIPPSQQSTQSWDSQNGPRPPSPFSPYIAPTPSPPSPLVLPSSRPSPPPYISSPSPSPHRRRETTRDLRIQIQTALLFKVPYGTIKEVLNVTERQILYAKHHRPTP